MSAIWPRMVVFLPRISHVFRPSRIISTHGLRIRSPRITALYNDLLLHHSIEHSRHPPETEIHHATDLSAAWCTDPAGPPDFDGDGTVGILDLLILLVNWGPCP